MRHPQGERRRRDLPTPGKPSGADGGAQGRQGELQPPFARTAEKAPSEKVALGEQGMGEGESWQEQPVR